MTRINVAVLPQELSREHLIAEHRELKRIPNNVRKKLKAGKLNLTNQPDKFKLGTGHEIFFYTRLGYLKERYMDLYLECCYRGYNVECYIDAWNDIPDEYMGSYQETNADRQLILNRIKENEGKKKRNRMDAQSS